MADEVGVPLSPLRRVADASVSLVASRLLKQLVGFVIEVALVRTLLPEVWEAVSRFLTFSLTLQVVLQFGFPESLLSLGARERHDSQAKRMLVRSAASLCVTASAFSVLLYPFASLRSKFLGSAEVSVLVAFALLLCAELVSGLVPAFLISRRFIKPAASYSVLSRLPTVAGALCAVSLFDSLSAVTLCMALGSSVSAVLGLWLCERLVPDEEQGPHTASFWTQLKFAAPVGVTRLAQMLNNQLDKWVVLGTLPAAAFGTYYLGAVETQLVPMLCQCVTSAMMPELVGAADKREFAKLLSTSIQKLCLFALPCFAFSFAFAEQGIVALYGVEHREAALPFRIFQLLLLHRFTNYALVFQALERPRVPFIASLIMLSLNAPLSFLLAARFGSVGAATATVVSLYVSTFYTFFELRRALEQPLSQLVPVRAYLTTLSVASLSLIPAFLVMHSLTPRGVSLIATLLTYLVTYFLLGRAVGVISRSDAAFLSDAARLRFLGTESRA